MKNFESLSWHGIHVHGFRLDAFNGENGSADLVLDIDHILKWEYSSEGFLFTVCQADIRSHEVFGLKLNLDYAIPTAEMSPFSLTSVKREAVTVPTGYQSYRWRLPINFPNGLVKFETPGYTLIFTGAPDVQA